MPQAINFQKSMSLAEESNRNNHISYVKKFYKTVMAGRPSFWNPFSSDQSIYRAFKRYAEDLSNPKSRREEAENYIRYIDNLKDKYDLNRNERIAKTTAVVLLGIAAVLGGLYYFGLFGIGKIVSEASGSLDLKNRKFETTEDFLRHTKSFCNDNKDIPFCFFQRINNKKEWISTDTGNLLLKHNKDFCYINKDNPFCKRLLKTFINNGIFSTHIESPIQYS